ncbi:MAG: dihydrofolate reductase [Steroidobacterales bacterium]
MTQPRAAVEFVVAVAENDVIGRGNGLPWRLSADLRHFKAITMGHSILMGRKTFESIGKALPGRRNLVLTRAADFTAPDCTTVRSLDEALAVAGTDRPLMVIGGAQVYRQSVALARRIHLTLVHTRIADGDAFFDGWRQPGWRQIGRERHEADDRNNFAYSFVTLERP